MPFPLNDYTRRSVERKFQKNGDFSWTEDFFLRVIDTSSSKHDLHGAAMGLREVGTEKALEPLRALMMYPNYDVQATAILTIAHIAGHRGTPVFIEALENPAFRQKGYALWAIADAGDATAIAHVSRYIAKTKSQIKRGRTRQTPVPYIVSYLARVFPTHPEATGMVDQIAEVWLALPEFERKGILLSHPQLAGQFESAANLRAV